ncbi:hypothetical protein F5Y01DRAFT_101484 [Xylaria sp. FL0043]|nr:hypothetical protein F5Y01DRAFT_101484 [Xylaria sp. FL0043]
MIDPRAYDNTLRNPETATLKKINAWAAYLYTKYSQSTYEPRDLQETLAEDIELAGIRTFERVDTEIANKIYNALRTKGVLDQEPAPRIKKARVIRMANGIYNLAYEPQPLQPPVRKSQTHSAPPREVKRVQPNASPTPSQQLLGNGEGIPVRRESPAIPTPETRSQSQEDFRTQARRRPITQGSMPSYDLRRPKARFEETLPSIENYPSVPPGDNPVRPGSVPHFQQTIEYPVSQYPPQTSRQPIFRTTPETTIPTSRIQIPPTYNIQNGTIPAAKYQIFLKTWQKKRNYSGEPYDLLYDKARQFVDFCRKLEITEEWFHAVFPTILTSRARDYYTYHIGPDRT